MFWPYSIWSESPFVPDTNMECSFAYLSLQFFFGWRNIANNKKEEREERKDWYLEGFVDKILKYYDNIILQNILNKKQNLETSRMTEKKIISTTW